MSISTKQSIARIPKLMLYSRPLHPELFTFCERRVQRHGDYEADTWIVKGGHMVRFTIDGQNMVEVVMEGGENLPEKGLAHVLPCMGEKEYEHEPEGRINYFTTLQTEALSQSLYLATFREMVTFAKETGSLYHIDETAAGPNLYVLDCQKYRTEFHVQSYHMTIKNTTVLRTQSVFEIVKS